MVRFHKRLLERNHELFKGSLLTSQDTFVFEVWLKKRADGPIRGNPTEDRGTHSHFLPPRRDDGRFGFQEACFGPTHLVCEHDTEAEMTTYEDTSRVWLDHQSLYSIVRQLRESVKEEAMEDRDQSVGGVFEILAAKELPTIFCYLNSKGADTFFENYFT